MHHPESLQTILDFIREIGLSVEPKSLDDSTFLPGIHIENGTVFYDQEKLEFPGDLLHEAGHLALMKPHDREKASGDLEPGDGKKMNADSTEIGVILWTYAAIVHLEIDPRIVFHEKGYRGSSDWFIDNFTSGTYIGLPLLQWMGFCKHQDETDDSVPEFPHMLRWLREPDKN